jgi:FHA domain
VQEELEKIDTGVIDALVEIQKEQEHVEGLMAKAEEKKDKVTEAVFARVRQDYDARLAALEDKARPLRDKARQEQIRLLPLHARFRKAVEDARLDLEELQFRREVGELPEKDFEARRVALDEALAARDRDFQDADGLAQRFASVVGEAPAAAAVSTADDAEPPTAPHARPDLDAPEAPPPADSKPADQGEATIFMKAPPDLDTPPDDAGPETALVTFAVLVAEEGSPPAEYHLAARTTIGRIKENDLCIPKSSVSRKHAVIEMTPKGYRITDLDSGNGTFVNDDKIQERLLEDGDRVRIGDHGYLFRAPRQ